jgi:hypothetical protein
MALTNGSAGLQATGHAESGDGLIVTGARSGARRGPRIRQTEVARTIKALLKAGLGVAAIKHAPDGTVLVIPGKPEDVPSSKPNPWDDAS